MKWFDLQVNQKLLDQLKKSDIGFKFDPNISKHRLMLNLTHMPPMREYSGMKIHHLLKYASVTAGVILVVSGSLVYAATNTKPGDKLFGLNKFGQQVILSLPLSAQTKASFQAKIVTSRLNDLDQLQEETTTAAEMQVETRNLQTVEASDEALSAAINNISMTRDALKASGKTQAADNLTSTLNQLELLAQQHEQKIQDVESWTQNEQIRESIDNHLSQIKKARAKVRQELNLDDSSGSGSNDSKSDSTENPTTPQ